MYFSTLFTCILSSVLLSDLVQTDQAYLSGVQSLQDNTVNPAHPHETWTSRKWSLDSRGACMKFLLLHCCWLNSNILSKVALKVGTPALEFYCHWQNKLVMNKQGLNLLALIQLLGYPCILMNTITKVQVLPGLGQSLSKRPK